MQAAELLSHPHLQPYVHKIQLQISNLRCDTVSSYWDEPEYMDKTTFPEPEDDSSLNPSVSGAGISCIYTTERIKALNEDLDRRLAELTVQDACTTVGKEAPSVTSKVRKNAALTRARTFGISRRPEVSSKNRRESVSTSKHLKSKIFIS